MVKGCESDLVLSLKEPAGGLKRCAAKSLLTAYASHSMYSCVKYAYSGLSVSNTLRSRLGSACVIGERGSGEEGVPFLD